MTLAEMFWEQGQQQCVNYNITCQNRPCTASQGIFCCKECEYNKGCQSKCQIKEKKYDNQGIIRSESIL